MSFHTAALAPIADAPLAQSPEFAAALTHVGRPPLRLARRGGAGAVQLLRRSFGPLRVGLVSRCDLSRAELGRFASEAEVGLLLLNPETDAGAHGLALQTPAHVAECDLAGSEAALRARLRQKWRNRLARAERSQLRVAETRLDARAGHWLFARERAQARARGYANWPEGLTRAFAAANRGQARIFEARAGGAPVAAMLFLCHGAVASYHMGWSGPEGRALCAHHLLMWRAMQRLRARGMLRLDLGGLATDRAPGLARFKFGTGAVPRRLGGSWLVAPRLLVGD
jgi:hypothetical protein